MLFLYMFACICLLENNKNSHSARPQLFSRPVLLSTFSSKLLWVISLGTEKASTLLLVEVAEVLGNHLIIHFPVFLLLYFLFWAKLYTAHLAGQTGAIIWACGKSTVTGHFPGSLLLLTRWVEENCCASHCINIWFPLCSWLPSQLWSLSQGQSQTGDFHNANQGQPLSAQALIPWLRRNWQGVPWTPVPAHPWTLCDLAQGGILQRAVLIALVAVIKLSEIWSFTL